MFWRNATKVVAIVHVIRIALALAWAPFVVKNLWNETFTIPVGDPEHKEHIQDHSGLEVYPWLFNVIMMGAFVMRIVIYTNLLKATTYETDIIKTLITARYCLYDLCIWTTAHFIGLIYLPLDQVNAARGYFWLVSMMTHLVSVVLVFGFVNRLKDNLAREKKCNEKLAVSETTNA